jgi:hypothetical protein
MSDGGLRQLFAKHLPEVHWQGIETGGTGRGIPDLNGCVGGVEFWIECKLTGAWAVTFEIGQVAWLERRARAGGRTFVAVRRHAPSGPRRGAAIDALYLYPGVAARTLSEKGMAGAPALGMWPGGPARWDWDRVSLYLTK